MNIIKFIKFMHFMNIIRFMKYQVADNQGYAVPRVYEPEYATTLQVQ